MRVVEQRHVLRHQRDARSQRLRVDRRRPGRRRRRRCPTAGRRSAGCRLKIVLLPAPDGPTMATVSPRADLEAHAVERGDAGPRRDRRSARRRRRCVPSGGTGSGLGRAGSRDLGPRRQQLQQPLGRAGRLRQLAPHLRELGDGAGREHGIEHELAEPAAADLAADHQARAEPQDADDARHDEGDGDGGEAGAGQRGASAPPRRRARRRRRSGARRSPPGRRRAWCARRRGSRRRRPRRRPGGPGPRATGGARRGRRPAAERR